jgi:lactoylglutathione lyase
MVRITNIADSLRFYCDGLGLTELQRTESERGRFTLIFLASPKDIARAGAAGKSGEMIAGLPMIELTYNWPNEDGSQETYTGGRNFGHLAYRTDHIYALCQKLIDMGITINRPPRDGHMAFVRSPDGISVELLQNGDSLPPASPWVDMANQGAW